MSNDLYNIEDFKENPDRLMELVANNQIDDNLIFELTDKDSTINQMKLFLLAQAKRELKRVIRLINFLDKVEDAFENKIDDSMDTMTLRQYQDVIETLSSCLKRSNDIINSVMKDDSLTNILIVNGDINNSTTNNVIENSLGLQSPESRNKVVKVIDNILGNINNLQSDIENANTSGTNDLENAYIDI